MPINPFNAISSAAANTVSELTGRSSGNFWDAVGAGLGSFDWLAWLRHFFGGLGGDVKTGLDSMIVDDGQGGDISSFGKTVNDLTGTTASNQFSAEQAALSREHETRERIASQEFNSAEAQKSRDWSEMMESTRYQRAMSDMMAAGVNPLLAFMSGSAGAPAGSGSTSAANSSPGASASASASGNSAAAVGGLITAITKLIGVAAGSKTKAAKKMFKNIWE